MTFLPVSGTEGYAEEADKLFQQYEQFSFAKLHRPILHLIPTTPSSIIDIGAGTGRDAAALAEMDHRVVAVEPTAELRQRAAVLHPSPRIEWVDDSLPDLTAMVARAERFDVVLLQAVWMHLDDQQRQRAMPHVASLVGPGGILILSLRHGPVPPGRRMFDVPPEETIAQAAAAGLEVRQRIDNLSDALGRGEVRWTRLAFVHAKMKQATAT